ncbi:hypothetical protein GUITHDRAFT_105002 [Guillardia theta CCMP2712]|uniref:Uncharacterized protein n=1 Tax=Guillardia theta (strain CCMP2712) TaxID=905079 RepID=L1JMH6_GUITC|nr:hypothetical protein GUITHDRAFT_105002 [Guillardia theta CCMP2712]EKX49474.1 hypothetical protein GUITHDRAFT_105002 [Guillardia theta CCMP2712]|eukprot:XP_005836454.1 hypothetical protein GUITHDRAFT_105002 [Guillardia theta CCMP2712]
MEALSLSVSPLSRIASADGHISSRPEMPAERLDLSDHDLEDWEDNILSDDSDTSLLPKFADSFRRKLGTYTCRANTPKLWTAKTQLDFQHQDVESGVQESSARFSETSPTEMSCRSTPRKDDSELDPLIKQCASIPTLDEVLEEEELELLREQQEMMNKEVQIMAELQLAQERQEEHRRRMEEEQMALMRAEQVAMINFLKLQTVKGKAQNARPTTAPAKSRTVVQVDQGKAGDSQLHPGHRTGPVEEQKVTQNRPQTAMARRPDTSHNEHLPVTGRVRPQTAGVRPQTALVTTEHAESSPQQPELAKKELARRRPYTAGASRDQSKTRSTFSLLNPFRALKRKFSIHPMWARPRAGVRINWWSRSRHLSDHPPSTM